MKVACVAIAKDEDMYLEEWIRYHLKLGFDDIFVFQNNWRYKDSFKFLRNPYVHFIPFDGHRMQNQCYNGFIKQHYQEYDFIVCIDIDEFIVVKTRTLKEWLSSLVDKECVFINWRIFGDSGLRANEHTEDWSVLKRFTMCDDRLHRLGKPLLNTRLTKDRVLYYNPHIVYVVTKPISLPSMFDTNGNRTSKKPWLTDVDCVQCVEIFHYRNKTYYECLERKFNKDDAFHEASKCAWRTDRSEFDRQYYAHNMNKVENTLARDFLYEK